MQHFNDGLLRVAAYIRVSTESSRQEESYETQKTYFMELLESNPSWISAGIYSDYGISGTSRERRTGFQRLLRHCEEGRIDRIITKSISRFARNTRDFLAVLELLKKNHVTIAFEKEQLDTKTAQSDLFLTAFGAVAQEESRSMSANIRWGIQKHYSKGETRNIPIYGYRYAEGDHGYEIIESGYTFKKIEIVEEQAKIVRRIFCAVAEGRSYISIARELNFENVPIPETAVVARRRNMAETPDGVLNSGMEEGWTAGHISRIIRLERYTGDVLLQKTYKPDYKSHRVVKNRGELEQFYVKNHHPDIVSRELFEKVRSVRNRKSMQFANRGVRKVYPFTGRLVCKHCGRFYWTRNRNKRPIWYCSSTVQKNGKNVCSAERIYEDQIVKMCRKAFTDRFHILPPKAADMFAQNYTVVDVSCDTDDSRLIEKLVQKLEMIQSADDPEHDRMLLKNQISKKRTREMEVQLAGLEKYWTALEADYEWRKKAVAWMKDLPGGQAGLSVFLNDFAEKYIRAFILAIEVESPLKYRIHWFDDIWSDVEMYSDEGAWHEEGENDGKYSQRDSGK